MERHWHCPDDAGEKPQLRLYNSLRDEKVPFVPAAGPGSKQLSWYICGPTVYDSAHMGHARNYLTFDIVRRVLEDYFGYNILYVIARRNYLLEAYKEEVKDNFPALIAFARDSLEAAKAKQSAKVEEARKAAEEMAVSSASKGSASDKRKADELQALVPQEELKLAQVAGSLDDLEKVSAAGSAETVLAAAGDAIAASLDAEKGSAVTDPAIYRAHAAKYEKEFLEDLQALGCRFPDVLTRVSEYIVEIIEYCEKIIDNGMAYEANGSLVYFDTQSFQRNGHVYGKLNPWAVGSAQLAAESEANFTSEDKRHPSDFALWKAGKAGEPTWDSPWGAGRPGWHIECSAMASALLGSRMDIHTGGSDLRFPHHDNELAQAEAFFHCEGCQQWVNYFLHCGHLNIEGLKMSKSLKNFITIRDALDTFSARQLRLMFVLQPWERAMVYGEQSRQEMVARESQLKNFFGSVAAVAREYKVESIATRWGEEEMALNCAIGEAQTKVHEALLDSINTSAVMDALSELIKQANKYIRSREGTAAAGGPAPQTLLLQKAGTYVTRILSVFGIVDGAADTVGLPTEGKTSGTETSAPFVDALSNFRDEVREIVRAGADKGKLMAACDSLRDDTLVDLGIRLEDRAGAKAIWKPDDPAVLRQELQERRQQQQEAARRKKENLLKAKTKDLEKFLGLAQLPPIPVALADKYGGFGEDGLPTVDKDGKALEGKALDKAKKEVEKAAKVRAPLQKKLEEDRSFLATLAAEVEALSAELAAM
eukprot:CAMPEP_0117672910 /NCGR_PEP_ID=MMETSP0804-20121206/14178_1 /TAXON_ID=1074897 /ORGANISM="Tetraselmis astigmatica, Strain CCMP880" /LENGTH=765 /DNA_ID=CAMNT_0005481587 /DNA_START=120 /DNA_END=2418 /DNA_ORIENTATION=-